LLHEIDASQKRVFGINLAVSQIIVFFKKAKRLRFLLLYGNLQTTNS